MENVSFTLTFSMEEMEIIKRGLRRMRNEYKAAFANANTAESEAKWFARAEMALSMLNEVAEVMDSAVREVTAAEEIKEAFLEQEEE